MYIVWEMMDLGKQISQSTLISKSMDYLKNKLK